MEYTIEVTRAWSTTATPGSGWRTVPSRLVPGLCFASYEAEKDEDAGEAHY